MDVIEIDAASFNGIDDIRNLQEQVGTYPAKAKYKVYIFDEAHRITKPAFDAFLKTLEEPPAHVIFILASTEIHEFPPTVQSRCQRFEFRSMGLDSSEAIAPHQRRGKNRGGRQGPLPNRPLRRRLHAATPKGTWTSWWLSPARK